MKFHKVMGVQVLTYVSKTWKEKQRIRTCKIMFLRLVAVYDIKRSMKIKVTNSIKDILQLKDTSKKSAVDGVQNGPSETNKASYKLQTSRQTICGGQALKEVAVIKKLKDVSTRYEVTVILIATVKHLNWHVEQVCRKT